jgi:L-aminopeptidase/D-esterase-like protein
LAVLVQANFGWRSQMLVAGVPVGREIPEDPAYSASRRKGIERDMGSIIAIVATDAPVLPHQLKRIARRISMGIARTGGVASNSSGDIFLAFSTAANIAGMSDRIGQVDMLPNPWMTRLFEATVQATEESIINAVVAAETMTGINNRTVHALPHDELQDVLRKYNRLE